MPCAEPPTLLDGRYRLAEVIGEGGMAVVWRAQDTLLGRTVAVKVLRAQYASDPDFLERLHSEARAAATLNDPGVVGVYDIGQDQGWHYIVMEWVPGCDLKAVIRAEGPLAPDRAVALCTQIAAAVGKAHASGIVHRDVKPQNVLVTPDGRPKVGDFGIARAMASAGTTAPGVVMGTLHYLAPEVASGAPASPASDVYSLGVVLYEMLTGVLPFEADSQEGVRQRIRNDAPAPVAELSPRVPSVLAGIVERAMARDPAARYADASTMAEALASFQRWSEQATGGLTLPDGAGAVRRPAVRTRELATTRRAQDPTLDLFGLLLALIALAAVAGLIPLWSAVRDRYLSSDGPSFSRLRGDTILLGAEAAPSVVPTVVMVPVPDVVGREAEAARAILEERGLGVSVEVEASSSVPEGLVVRQRPQPDGVVSAETVVHLTVSGQQPLEIPALAGSWAEVSASLEAMGFVPRRRAVWGGDPNAVEQVIGLDPPPGSRWPRGAPVDVSVNSGPWLALGVDFADNIHLRGIEVHADRFAPGETIGFWATWESIAVEDGETTAPRQDYVVRAELVAADGTVAARDEHLPLNGTRPTSGWMPGEVLSGDAFSLVVPPEAAPGQYALWLDLYAVSDPTVRLAVRASAFTSTAGDRVRLLLAMVESPGA